LLDLTSLVVYGVTYSGVEVSNAYRDALIVIIKNVLEGSDKNWLYENMAEYFEKDVPFPTSKYGGRPSTEKIQWPTSKSRATGKHHIVNDPYVKEPKKKSKPTNEPDKRKKAIVPSVATAKKPDDTTRPTDEDFSESDFEVFGKKTPEKGTKTSGMHDVEEYKFQSPEDDIPLVETITATKKKSPSVAKASVDEIELGTTKPVEEHVDVLQFHPSRPPKYIHTKFTSWYWTLEDVKHKDTWHYLTSVGDHDNRIIVNTINLIFTEVAVEYAKTTQATEGKELLNVLEEPFECLKRPANWPGDDQRKKWNAMLIELDEYATKLVTSGGFTPKPLVQPGQGPPSFCDYFASFVEDNTNKKPENTNAEEKSAPDEDTKVVPFWNSSKVSNIAVFNLDNVQAMIQKWKCCILYDTMCRSYFKSSHKRKEVSDALFGNSEIKKLFPSTHLKEEWEGTFNMLVYHLQHIEIHATTDNWMDPENKHPVFLDALTKTTGRMLEVALTAGVTQADVVMGEAPSITIDETANVPAGKPRPPLCEAVVKDLAVYDELCGLFFHHDGHLRQDLRSSVNWDAPHGFTSFGNFFTKDTRWFISFTKVPSNITGEFDTINHLLSVFVYFCINIQFLNFF